MSYKGVIFHNFILTRDKKETIYKIYKNQKEEFVKVDWYQLLQEDFKFINISMNEEKIRNTSKDVNKKEIKGMINKAAFKYFMELKYQQKKLNNMKSEHLRIQAYLVSKKIQ